MAPRTSETASLRWFKRLMWAGILANLAVACTSLAIPEKVLEMLQLAPATPLVWPRFAAFLLILLSLFYVAAARDPVRNAYVSIVAVICRFGGVIFFGIVGGNYIAFGLFDLVFGLPQALLLARLLRQAAD